MVIIPAILTSDAVEFETWMARVVADGRYGRVQVDFIDGEYVNNKSIRVEECKSVSKFGLKFDAHLMVVQSNIDKWAQEAKKAGFDRIIPQLESISYPENYRGLALDVHSPVESIKPYLGSLDVVVVMSVEPGFGGQEFAGAALLNVKELLWLREERQYKYKICVDGGVGREQVEYLAKEGVDEVAVGVKRVLSW
ncbi:hypothetical protein A2634_02320 [Candidatus Amesbacteria bacterium RIFCSPHIGHO2_01_FULL_48_32]|uniref:Ribulose-phosphate 3-epimerase n=1 Tax=Candidatus Amesbacteria bacterium RIFCSPLOWO2_01_FULL_48_25 TaxID=1797259 RepID=A0A1F4ZDM6_9BACT|nr:MAG: hypothetical protein A2634_02320 [Candidatus Amesbacteria bacterium RIFCSPHIGHO2_01_FULL_48_32]OGD04420.1 MAG: hypothetical protein A2989_05325 [Candidatus Amesbacteria bacterium RIFCSPLOWO2_01_FULL_48_25]HJZ06261.1 hypothetical protein [Patescibacteria group bacterium]